MPFKLKHVFHTPAKVCHEVARTGILGNSGNGDGFRVLGVKVGKDLVPVVQAAVVVAAVAVGGPAAAAATGTSLTVASAAVGATASATVTGLSGGDEGAMTKAAASGAIGGAAAGVVPTLPTLPAQVAVSATAGAACSAINDSNVVAGAVVGGVTPMLPDISGNAYVNSAAKGSVTGGVSAAVTGDNVINSALSGAGCSVASTAVVKALTTDSDLKDSKEVKKQDDVKDLKECLPSEICTGIDTCSTRADSKYFVNISETDLHKQTIKNVKVARRGLTFGNITLPHFKDGAHSAVVVTTNNNELFLIEFMNTDKVEVYKLGQENMSIVKTEPTHISAQITTSKTDLWTVQATGYMATTEVTVQQAVEFMGKNKYNFSVTGLLGLDKDYYVCHTAQEALVDKVCGGPES